MERTKYPRTPHLPHSPGYTGDDERLVDEAHFVGRTIVMTEKLDGEATSLYPDGYSHARSVDSAHHPSRSWIKAHVAPTLIGNLPNGWRVAGENLTAVHSLRYDNLPTYFFVYSIWTEANVCLSWEDTELWAGLLGLHTVPVLYKGLYDLETIKAHWNGQSVFGGEGEGYVIRSVEGFSYTDFGNSIAKFVRKNHVQTDSVHWSKGPVQLNGLKTQ